MGARARKNGLVVQSVDEETLVYDLESDKAFCLNSTSAAVWNLCDGERSAEQITELLKTQIDHSVTVEIVRFALDQLDKEGLVEGHHPVAYLPKGLSRRMALQRLGMATAVSLPIVASLIAPPAAFAQSCVPAAMSPPGCPCVSPSECSGGSCGMVTPGMCG